MQKLWGGQAKLQHYSELNVELKELKSADTPEAIVWDNFSGRSNKITTENIAAHTDRIEDEVASINQFIASTTTLKALKTELNSRIKHREASAFFNFRGDLESMLDVPFQTTQLDEEVFKLENQPAYD